MSTKVYADKLGKVGRLGNQLFEVASTLGIARAQGLEPAFPSWDYQHVFSCPPEYFGQNSNGAYSPEDFAGHLDSRARVYLQDYGLWKDVASEVVEWFTPSDFANGILHVYANVLDLHPRPYLSLHVRRGDNVYDPGVPDKNLYHPPRPISYYVEAIQQMEGQYETLVIFSDDIPWCKSTFAGYNPIFFEGGKPRLKEHEPGYKTEPFDDWIDLLMMAYCEKHIISNSTYSWWGAWLSGDDSPIYPWPFFGPKLDYTDASLMFPESWQRLDHA